MNLKIPQALGRGFLFFSFLFFLLFNIATASPDLGILKSELNLSKNLTEQFKIIQVVLDKLFENWLEFNNNFDNFASEDLEILNKLNIDLKGIEVANRQEYCSISDVLLNEAANFLETLKKNDPYNSEDVLNCFCAYEEACRSIYLRACSYYELKKEWLKTLNWDAFPPEIKNAYLFGLKKNEIELGVSRVVNYMKLDMLKCFQKKGSLKEFEKHINLMEEEVKVLSGVSRGGEFKEKELTELQDEIKLNIEELKLCLCNFIDFIKMPDRIGFKKYFSSAGRFDKSSIAISKKYFKYLENLLK